MEDKKIKISLSAILLAIAIIVIVVMAFVIFSLTDIKSKSENEIQKLKDENQSMQKKLDLIQNTLNSVTTNVSNTNKVTNTISETTTPSTNPKTDKEQVEEVATAFVKAVNDRDWTNVEKYSSSDIVDELKKYNVTNMTVDLTTLEKNPIQTDGYYCLDNYNMYYQGSSDKKDFSLGCLFCIDKINDSYKVTSFSATGL